MKATHRCFNCGGPVRVIYTDTEIQYRCIFCDTLVHVEPKPVPTHK